MRVALFLPNVETGGAERVTLNLARGFSDRGLEVDIVLASHVGDLGDLIPWGLRVIDLNCKRVLASVPGLVRYLRKERPRVLLSALDHANIVALLAKLVSRVRTRVAVCSHQTISANREFSRSLRSRLVPVFMKALYPFADVVLAVSEGAAEDLSSWLGWERGRVRVVYNPVVTSDLLARARKPPTNPWFRVGELPIVLAVGSLLPVKDFATLVRAFAAVRSVRPARLMILGEGPERGSLMGLARSLGVDEDFALPGFVGDPYPYMAHAGVFVLSSLSEALPTVLIEAMACGAPIVSTDCPNGPREILAGGQYGRLVSVGSSTALAKAILASLEDPRRGASKAAWQRFDVTLATDEYLRVLGLAKYA